MDIKHASPSAHKKSTGKVKRSTAETKAKYDAKSFSKLRQVNESDYDVLESLGEGASGTAFLATVRKTNQMVVIKEIHGEYVPGNSKLANLEKFKRELSILHRLKRLCRAQLVPCYVGYFWKPEPAEDDPSYGHWNFVTNYLGKDAIPFADYLTSSDLNDEVKAMSVEQRWSRFQRITSNLVYGMKRLHDLDVTHSDPHLGNILIHLKTLKITFIDFGEACYKGFCTITESGLSADYDKRRSRDDWRRIVVAVIELIDSLQLHEVEPAVINRYLHSFDLGDVQLSVRAVTNLWRPVVLRIHT
jgi:serine/threonine protein kinase